MNYEERAGGHKRRMEADANGLPLGYSHAHSHAAMDNGHQIPYQPYAGSYNAHYASAEVSFGGYAGPGELGYAARGLAYAPPAHQAYSPLAPHPHPPHQHAPFQQQMLPLPYDQHLPHPHHKPAWPQQQPQMQPVQTTNDQVIKNDMKIKQEIKVEPAIPPEAAGSSVILMRPTSESHPIDPNSPILPNQLNEDPPKIKIKTDIFQEGESANVSRRGVITESGELEKPTCPVDSDISLNRQSTSNETGPDGTKHIVDNMSTSKDGHADSNVDLLGGNIAVDGEGAKSRISDSGNSTDSANKNKLIGFSDFESSSSSEDETKIPNEIYFGTPDISTYRPKMMTPVTSTAIPATPGSKPLHTPTVVGGIEVKKRGRPKGSCNKPKPPNAQTGLPRPQVGRPRGGGHSASYMPHPLRPFKRDFSGIRFRRRWSDDGLDSSHIPNEVYFGDVPVSMEVLFNYYDSHAEREKAHSHHKTGHQTPGNVTLVYSSSDSSSDDSSGSDTSDTDNDQMQIPMKRGPGRPRGSKTVNRRSDSQRLSSGATSPGDRPLGITDMKKLLKVAGIEYDYVRLIEGCLSNKERVSKLMGLLHDKGLEGPPTLEACRALYAGPPPRRRGPKPGTKRTPKVAVSPDLSVEIPSPMSTPPGDEESRRITRGQTSGKPRQRIVISSDEEDAHTPLSKLRTMR